MPRFKLNGACSNRSGRPVQALRPVARAPCRRSAGLCVTLTHCACHVRASGPICNANLEHRSNSMGRFAAFLYGIASYVLFLITVVYAIGFVGGLVVPKIIDSGTVVPVLEALVVNLVLMAVFAIQHSVMARKSF